MVLPGENINFNFTEQYCTKINKLADVTQPVDYIITDVLPDAEFMYHYISFEFLGSGSEIKMFPKLSPISGLLREIDIIETYKNAKNGTMDSNWLSLMLSLIGMLLLPIGIAFRLVKTSVELFIPLE
jgi:hypothetical protein